MTPQAYRPENKVVAGAVLTVAATYGYFLIFAQFGFLKMIAATGEAGGFVRMVMAVMGLAGMGGSVLAAWAYRVERSRLLLAAGFAGCAIATGCSMLAGAAGSFYAVALLVGLGTGFTTVTLACCLRWALGDRRLGLVVGLGTGLAYGCCNLPAVFQAAAVTQAWLAVLAAGAGVAGTFVLTFVAPAHPPVDNDYSKTGVLVWVMILLALVGLDSAAFYIIQHTPDLKENLWSGTGRLLANAGMHLIAAVLAGLALDRLWLGRTVLAGALALLGACLLLRGGAQNFASGVGLYTAGVSVYSVALVYYPARGLRPWLAALVYAVAGWGGSALGIGLAENHQVLPERFIVFAAGAIVGLGLLVRQIRRGRRRAT